MWNDDFQEVDEEQYKKDLKRRQEEHLKNVRRNRGTRPFQPCMHDKCPSCLGTGIKSDGTSCIHYISCSCPRCTPYYLSSDPSYEANDYYCDDGQGHWNTW